MVYKNRTCTKCLNYPCFIGIDKCKNDFAKIGCIDYNESNMMETNVNMNDLNKVMSQDTSSKDNKSFEYENNNIPDDIKN